MYAFPYLSRMLGAQMFARFVAMMPPPRDATPEARQDRDVLAMCMVRQMGPLRSLEEASLAITVVAADAHAHEALREASENTGNIKVVMQCRAQASLMMRTRHKAAAELEALMRNHPPAWWVEQRAEQAAETQADAAPEPSVSEPAAPEPLAPVASAPEPPVERMAPPPRPIMPAQPAMPNKSSALVSDVRAMPPVVPPSVRLRAVAQAARV